MGYAGSAFHRVIPDVSAARPPAVPSTQPTSPRSPMIGRRIHADLEPLERLNLARVLHPYSS